MIRLVSIVFGVLFGGVFAGAGIFVSMQTAVPVYQSWHEAKDWVPVSAELLNVSGSDSNTIATYRYSYNGKVYENDRVYLADFSDNIGSYHSDLQQRLRNAKSKDLAVEVWVDGVAPSRSVLDRNMRWGLFVLMTCFCSVFVFIGLFVIISSFLAKPKKRHNIALPNIMKLRKEWKQEKEGAESFVSFLGKRRAQLLDQNDANNNATIRSKVGENWQERKGWEDNKIRSSAKSGAMSFWFFAIFWNGISYSILYMFLSEWNGRDYGALLIFIFPLAGLFLLYQAIKRTLEFTKFGVIEYEMDPYPGAIGGNVGGFITIDKLREWNAKYTVKLQCLYSYVSGSGKNRSRVERINWAEEGFAKVERTANGVRLEFCFDVPEGLSESDIRQSGSYNYWKLTVHSDLPGVDLNRSYNIPVFSTGEATHGIYKDISEEVEDERLAISAREKSNIERGRFEETALSKSLKVKKRGRGLLLIFPMFRNKILALFGLIFGGGFSFATYSVVSSFSGAGFFSVFAYLFIIPFAIVGLIGMIAAIYFPLNNLRVWIENRQVIVLRRLLFIPIFYKKVRKREVQSLSLKRSGATGQGVKQIEHYKIIAHLRNNNEMTIAEGINGKDLATHFKEYLYKKIQSC